MLNIKSFTLAVIVPVTLVLFFYASMTSAAEDFVEYIVPVQKCDHGTYYNVEVVTDIQDQDTHAELIDREVCNDIGGHEISEELKGNFIHALTKIEE